jgi:ABC-type transport system involved in cytochrome bd biosynthesis fused ATPase/permease subunit
MLKACTMRREYFNYKFQKAMEFLSKHRNHKSNQIKVSIIDNIPYFAEYLPQAFEQSYFESFMTYLVGLLSKKY